MALPDEEYPVPFVFQPLLERTLRHAVSDGYGYSLSRCEMLRQISEDGTLNVGHCLFGDYLSHFGGCGSEILGKPDCLRHGVG